MRSRNKLLESGEYAAADVGLGAAIRIAREGERIGVRELARRCGISPGQVSRIESGHVGKPEEGTLRSIARSLGRSALPLMYLAGHCDETDIEARMRELFDDPDLSIAMVESVEDAFHDGDTQALVSCLWSDDRILLGKALADFSPRSADLQAIVHAWPSLSEERKRLVLAFVEDQVVLSTAERMPNPPGRYEISIELHERSHA